MGLKNIPCKCISPKNLTIQKIQPNNAEKDEATKGATAFVASSLRGFQPVRVLHGNLIQQE